MKLSKTLVVMTGMVLTIVTVQVIQEMMPHCPVLPKPSGVITEAQAIPAFARKYRVSCATCHAAMPRLNPFGEAFRLNGNRWPNPGGFDINQTLDETMAIEKPVELGAKEDADLWPKKIRPGAIPLTVPLGIRNRSYMKDNLSNGQKEMGWEWELFIAGNLGKNITAYGHINTEGFNKPYNEKEDVHIKLVANVSIENIFKSHLLNLQLGTVGMEENMLPNIRSHSTQRISDYKNFLNYLVMPYPTLTPSTLTWAKKNNLQSFRRGPGAMVHGNTARWRYAIGNQLGMQEGGGSESNITFFQMAYKIGGMDYNGKYENKPDKYDYAYKEKSLHLGFIANTGETSVKSPYKAPATIGKETKDFFYRVGGDFHLQFGSLSLKAGAVTGKNKNPYGAYSDTFNIKSVDVFSYVIYPEVYVYPWLMVGAWYDFEEMKVPANLKLGKTDRARIVPTLSVLLTPNFRIGLEASLYTDRREDSKGVARDNDDFNVHIDFAF